MTASHLGAPNIETKTVLLNLELSLMRAFCDGDQLSLAAFLDETCVGFGIFGDRYERADFISRERVFTLKKAELLALETRFCGEVAITLSEWDVHLLVGAAIVQGPVRITRIWNLKLNRWRLMSFHVSDARLGKMWSALKKSNS